MSDWATLQPGRGWATEQELAELTKRTGGGGGGGGGSGGGSGGNKGGEAGAAARRIVAAQASGGARSCAMRALEAFAAASTRDDVLPAAILRVPGGITLLAEVANGEHGCKSSTLQKQASVLLTTLGL